MSSEDILESSLRLPLSQLSINNSPSSRSIIRKSQNLTDGWRKKSWLRDYIELRTVNKETMAFCKGCGNRQKNRGHPRLIAHLKVCDKSNYDPNIPSILNDPMTTESVTADLFVRALVDAGWSLNSLELPSVKKFFARLSTHKDWIVPSRRDISSILIPRLSHKSYKDFVKSLKDGNMTISIEFDHWDDANGRSFLGVLATTPNGDRFLLDLRDVSIKGHFASVTVEELVQSLETVPKKAINSIVSDNASACKKARCDLVKLQDFKHVIQHRCLAHFINLVGSKITKKSEFFGKIAQKASKVVGVISGSSYWTGILKELQLKTPKTLCNVRWFSMATMLSSLLEIKTLIIEKILVELDNDQAKIVQSLDWDRLTELLSVVMPIATCIGHIEGKDTSLGEGMHHILEYARQLFEDDKQPACGISDAKEEARKSFLHYFCRKRLSPSEFGLFLAAYALDRRFNLNYLTEEGVALALEAIVRIALSSGATLAQVQASLFMEFKDYREFKGDYRMTSQRPIQWWKDRRSIGILAKIGLKAAHLKASSANIERTFSSIKYIQGDNRLNLSDSTLLHTTRLKISLKGERDEAYYNQSEEWLESSIGTQESIDTTLDDSSEIEEDALEVSQTEYRETWLDDQTVEVKTNYRYFFKYIDFSITHEACEFPEMATQEYTDDQIRQCVQSGLSSRDDSSQVIVVDDEAQVMEIDAMIMQTQ